MMFRMTQGNRWMRIVLTDRTLLDTKCPITFWVMFIDTYQMIAYGCKSLNAKQSVKVFVPVFALGSL